MINPYVPKKLQLGTRPKKRLRLKLFFEALETSSPAPWSDLSRRWTMGTVDGSSGQPVESRPIIFPKQSMYGMFTYMYHKNMSNVGWYTTHGWYGVWIEDGLLLPFCLPLDVCLFGRKSVKNRKSSAPCMRCDMFLFFGWAKKKVILGVPHHFVETTSVVKLRWEERWNKDTFFNCHLLERETRRLRGMMTVNFTAWVVMSVENRIIMAKKQSDQLLISSSETWGPSPSDVIHKISSRFRFPDVIVTTCLRLNCSLVDPWTLVDSWFIRLTWTCHLLPNHLYPAMCWEFPTFAMRWWRTSEISIWNWVKKCQDRQLIRIILSCANWRLI